MFSGAWREAKEDIVHIKVIDPKINLDCKYVCHDIYYCIRKDSKLLYAACCTWMFCCVK